MTARNRMRPMPRSSGWWARNTDIRSAPTAGADAQEPEPAGPACEDVARVDGQQRGGPAEQHGEQVERHRAEEHRPAPDEGDAREHRLEGDGLARPRGSRRLRIAAARMPARHEERAPPSRTRRRGAERVEEPSERRARRSGRSGSAETIHAVAREMQRPRHHVGHQRGRRGVLEGARRADQGHEQRGCSSCPATWPDRARGQGAGGGRLDDLADGDDERGGRSGRRPARRPG